MRVTDVIIRKLNSLGKMKAVVSITFDNEFAVHDIKVIKGDSGLFVAMPSRKVPNGEFKDIAHPIKKQLRDRIESIIIERYQEALLEEEQQNMNV